jgi:NADPH:quinone reductase-like Zn-dependent oxidoreductase
MQDPKKILACKKKCFDMISSGQITSLVDEKEFKTLDSVPDAIDYMLSGLAVGKVVVSV